MDLKKELTVRAKEFARVLDEAALDAVVTITEFDTQDEALLSEMETVLQNLDASGKGYELTIKIAEGPRYFGTMIFDECESVISYYIPVSVFMFSDRGVFESEKCYLPKFWEESSIASYLEASTYETEKKQFSPGSYEITMYPERKHLFNWCILDKANVETYQEENDCSLADALSWFDMDYTNYIGCLAARDLVCKIYIQKTDDENFKPFTIYVSTNECDIYDGHLNAISKKGFDTIEYETHIFANDAEDTPQSIDENPYTSINGKILVEFPENNTSSDMCKPHYETWYRCDADSSLDCTFDCSEGFNITDMMLQAVSIPHQAHEKLVGLGYFGWDNNIAALITGMKIKDFIQEGDFQADAEYDEPELVQDVVQNADGSFEREDREIDECDYE